MLKRLPPEIADTLRVLVEIELSRHQGYVTTVRYRAGGEVSRAADVQKATNIDEGDGKP
jgi:hypothetical protein